MDILDESESSYTYERRVFLFKKFLKITIFCLVLSVIFLSFVCYIKTKRAKRNIIMGDLLLQYFQGRKQEDLGMLLQIANKYDDGVMDIALMLSKANKTAYKLPNVITSSFLEAQDSYSDIKEKNKVLYGNFCLIDALRSLQKKDKDAAMKILTKAAGNSFSDVVKIEAKMLIANIEEF